MRDIREQLNCGLEVDMEAQPVVLLVGLLKVGSHTTVILVTYYVTLLQLMLCYFGRYHNYYCYSCRYNYCTATTATTVVKEVLS